MSDTAHHLLSHTEIAIRDFRRAINEDNADECDRCAAQIIRLVRAAAWCVSSPAAGEQAARELGIEEVLDG